MKKILAMLLALMMVLSLCACGKQAEETPAPAQETAAPVQETPAPAQATVAPAQETPAPITPQPEETLAESHKEPYIEPVIREMYQIDNRIGGLYGAFSEGRAWVEFSVNGTRRFGVIDKNGFLVYMVNAEDIDFYGTWIHNSSFDHGISCLYIDNNYSYIDHPGLIIISSDGQEVFNSAAYKDSDYYYLGCHDGNTFALEHTMGFSESSWSFCVINPQGDIIFREENQNVKDLTLIHYCGEGIYFAGYRNSFGYPRYHFVYNTNTNQFYQSGSLSPASAFENGEMLERENSITFRVKDFDSLDTLKARIDSAERVHVVDECDYSEGLAYEESYYYDGPYRYKGDEQGYFNFRGELEVPVPSDWNVRHAMDFSGGYGILILTGVDQRYYISAVDRTGEIMYDPKRIDNDSCDYWHGYAEVVIDGDTVILDPYGNPVGDALPTDVAEYFSDDRSIEGFILEENPNYKDKYIYRSCRSDANDITYIYFVSNIRDVVDRTFTGSDAESDNTEQLQERQESKTYQNISSFSIEGKWKNVGTGTYGQVQSGAIVAFDGTHCDIVSPQDTYALYKNGDNWQLDCTTLFGDTVSFTVKTVDEDHIDVYYAAGYVELARVN